MLTIHTIAELHAQIQNAKQHGQRVGFVPTMGNLHAGHISLVDAAREACDFVVASIFVNPLQFGTNEDLDKYPKTLTEDQDKLGHAGCDLLFAPCVEEMYPGGKGIKTTVSVADISAQHCGASRPGHFAGVATVVAKLFAMVQPDAAFFGKKDWQQLAVIRQMAADLSFPIDIIGIATARNNCGLALSSRNGYLNTEQLQLAPELYATLRDLQARIKQGERDYLQLQQAAATQLNSLGFKTDYVHICQQQSLLPATADDQALVILAAAQLGPARLIDNLDFRLDT